MFLGFEFGFLFRSYQLFHGISSQGKVGTVYVHFTIMEVTAVEVFVNEVVVELQHLQLGINENEHINVDREIQTQLLFVFSTSKKPGDNSAKL